jgi:hypothetical protein
MAAEMVRHHQSHMEGRNVGGAQPEIKKIAGRGTSMNFRTGPWSRVAP